MPSMVISFAKAVLLIRVFIYSRAQLSGPVKAVHNLLQDPPAVVSKAVLSGRAP